LRPLAANPTNRQLRDRAAEEDWVTGAVVPFEITAPTREAVEA
jgi:hypothetical protein